MVLFENKPGFCYGAAMVILDEGMLPDETRQRFWRKVKIAGADECWPWTAFLNRDGYGYFTAKPWNGPATHVSLTLDGRQRPDKTQKACHRCDNPVCVNPRHLWWGTQKENISDASQKGRMKGPRSWKLHSEDVEAISASDNPPDILARQFRVTLATIKKIKRGQYSARTAREPISRAPGLRYRTI